MTYIYRKVPSIIPTLSIGPPYFGKIERPSHTFRFRGKIRLHPIIDINQKFTSI